MIWYSSFWPLVDGKTNEIPLVADLLGQLVVEGRLLTMDALLITSLPPERGGPRDLLAANRGHWGIENSLHWIRHVTLGEDHCPIYKKDAPQAFAALRNLMLALMRLLGHTNVAEAIDPYSAQPELALVSLAHLMKHMSATIAAGMSPTFLEPGETPGSFAFPPQRGSRMVLAGQEWPGALP